MSSYADTQPVLNSTQSEDHPVQCAPRLDLVVGSAWQSLVEYRRLTLGGTTIVVDVAAELASLRIHPAARSSMQLFPSGSNSTIKSLAEEYGSPHQLRAMEAFPNMSLEDGIGQVRGFGEMAARQLTGRADFQAFTRQLPGALLADAGGEMPRIVFNTYLGSAGGKASWGAQLLCEETLKVLLSGTDATIDASIYVIGGVSFTGPAFPRTQVNASASIAQWLHVNQHLPSDRVNLTLYFMELPPVGTNKSLRSQCLLDHHAAMLAPAVEENIRTLRSNRAASGEYGNVLLTRSDQFQRLTKREIVGEVAASYLPQLESVLRVRADSARFNGLRFEYEHRNAERPSVKQALEQALRARDVDQLLEPVLAPRGTRAGASLILRDGGSIDLRRVREHFAAPIRNLAQVRDRLATCKGASDLLASEIVDLRRQLDPVETHLDKALLQIEKQFARLLHRSSKKRVTWMLEKLAQAREIRETLEEIQCELSVLQKAESHFHAEWRELRSRIDRLRRSVKRCALHAPERKGPAWIAAVPLARSLPELLAVSDTVGDDSGAMHHVLSTMTGTVTLDGLVRITGARSATIESLVAAVVSRQGARRGPSWGGAAREDEGDAFLVYPPVEPALQKRLIARHRELGHDLTRISFSKGADASVNVVALELHSCSELREILTPYYQTGLSRVLAGPARSLFLSDARILKDLGIAGIEDSEPSKPASSKSPRASASDS